MTVSSENHEKAVELSKRDKTSISSVYERSLEEKYNQIMLVERSEKMPSETISEDGAMITRSQSLTDTELMELRDDLEFRKLIAERQPENLISQKNYAEAVLKLATSLSQKGEFSESGELLDEAMRVYSELLHRNPEDQEIEEKIEEISAIKSGKKSSTVEKPTLELILTLNMPGRPPLILSSLEMKGDPKNLINAAGELLKHT